LDLLRGLLPSFLGNDLKLAETDTSPVPKTEEITVKKPDD
jgi:hypothetical protein